MPARTKNPAIPSNQKDRTGTAGILRRCRAVINVRFAALERAALALFDGIQTYALNDAESVLYALTPQQLAQLAGELQASLDYWLVSKSEDAARFWYSPYVAEAHQLGAAQSVANLTNLSASYAASRNLQQVVFSEPYRNRVGIAQTKSYEHWLKAGADIRGELTQIIGSAVADGRNPKAVRSMIHDRLGVSKARAMVYAQTDITDSLRQARIAEAEHAEAEYGFSVGLLWTSALKPTTRPWHASRSGKVYTPAEVRKFYSENGGREKYNCYCATTECLLDENDKPILTDKLKATMAKEREGWEAEHGKATP